MLHQAEGARSHLNMTGSSVPVNQPTSPPSFLTSRTRRYVLRHCNIDRRKGTIQVKMFRGVQGKAESIIRPQVHGEDQDPVLVLSPIPVSAVFMSQLCCVMSSMATSTCCQNRVFRRKITPMLSDITCCPYQLSASSVMNSPEDP